MGGAAAYLGREGVREGSNGTSLHPRSWETISGISHEKQIGKPAFLCVRD